MGACARPGCSGQIEGGYCNVCGPAGAGASSRVATAEALRTCTRYASTDEAGWQFIDRANQARPLT